MVMGERMVDYTAVIGDILSTGKSSAIVMVGKGKRLMNVVASGKHNK